MKTNVNCLAYDIGASGSKLYVGRFNGERLSLETLSRSPNAPIEMAGCLYWDFPRIFETLERGILSATKHMNVDSIGIDSFSNDFSLIDSKGAILCPVRCYRDSRVARVKEKLLKELPPKELYSLSGNQIAIFNTLFQIAAMQNDGHGYLLENAHKLLHVPDLLCYFLTGEAFSEYTISSVTQMFDFAAGTWNKRILDAFSISESLMSPLVMPGTVNGVTKGGIKVVNVCEHDTASAFLSSAIEGKHAIFSSGTWVLVGCETKKPIITDYSFSHNIANEGGYEGCHRLILNVMGNWLLQEIRREYEQEGYDYDFDKLATLAKAENPFVWLVDVNGDEFFSPGNMRQKLREASLSACGRAPETPAQFARCVYDSLAMRYRYALEVLEGVGGELPVINILGGGSKDSLMCGLTASVCGKPVLAGPSDATGYGNVIAQLMALGEVSGPEEGRALLRKSYTLTEFEPNALPGCEEAYQAFKEKLPLI